MCNSWSVSIIIIIVVVVIKGVGHLFKDQLYLYRQAKCEG